MAADPSFLSSNEFQVYLEAFSRGGTGRPLRTWRDRTVEGPCLVAVTDKDPVLRPELAEGIERWLPHLRKELIRDCGHWTQQERPEEVNRLLLELLADLAG